MGALFSAVSKRDSQTSNSGCCKAGFKGEQSEPDEHPWDCYVVVQATVGLDRNREGFFTLTHGWAPKSVMPALTVKSREVLSTSWP